MSRNENAAQATKVDGAVPQAVKRRAACDECRTKKLKCTGEQPACSRCVRERISCIYSPQKQMGRPKKRQREEGDEANNKSPRHGSTPRLVNQNSRHGNTGPAHASWDAGLSDATRSALGPTNEPFDMGSLESAFTPGGHLQAWLQPYGIGNWDQSATNESSHPPDSSVPGLTPDSSSNSPPTASIPAELHPNSNGHLQALARRDNSTQLLLDPSLTGGNLGLPSSAVPTCSCLSTMYLTLNTLQSMDPSFSFPYALHPLREAMQTATEVLRCETCPTKFITAIQNTQMIGTLLVSIAERFGKVLESITKEATRAEAANENKKFQLAGLNTSTSHLHAGGLNCSAAFSLDLSPTEWRSMSKKVVRAEVHGPSNDSPGRDDHAQCVYFLGITKQMQNRQEKWITNPTVSDPPTDAEGKPIGGPKVPKADHMCLKLAEYANKAVEGFDWS